MAGSDRRATFVLLPGCATGKCATEHAGNATGRVPAYLKNTMSNLEILSLLLNALLVVACLCIATLSQRGRFAEMASRRMLQQQIDTQRHQTDLLWRAYLESGASIGASLKEIREDIDRNYGHTHTGHVLDRIAYEFEHARGAIQPNALLARDILDADDTR